MRKISIIYNSELKLITNNLTSIFKKHVIKVLEIIKRGYLLQYLASALSQHGVNKQDGTVDDSKRRLGQILVLEL